MEESEMGLGHQKWLIYVGIGRQGGVGGVSWWQHPKDIVGVECSWPNPVTAAVWQRRRHTYQEIGPSRKKEGV